MKSVVDDSVQPESGATGTRLSSHSVVERFVEAPLLAHAFAVLAVLVVLIPFMRPMDTWTSDEGAVRFQVELLATRGSWSFSRPFADLDPEEITSPIHASTIVDDRYSPYTKQPLLPVILVPFRQAVGDWALVLPSIVGALTAAIVGAMIAGTIEHRIRNLTLWILAFATPILFYGFTTLAHTLATALSAIALYVVIGHGDRYALRWIVALSGVFLATLLRAEAAAFGVALAIAVLLVQPKIRWRVKGTLSGLLLTTTLSAVAVNRLWAVSVGGADPVSEGQGIFEWFRFVSGMFSSLVLVDFGSSSTLTAVLLMAGGITLLVLTVDREPENTRLLRVLATVSIAGSILLLALAPVVVGGFLAATPFLLAGLLLVQRTDMAHRSICLILTASSIFAAGVFAFQESGGGGSQWGGRYLMLALPGLVSVAVYTLRSLIVRAPSARALILVPLLIASMVMSAEAVVALRTGREKSAALTAEIVQLGVRAGGSRDQPVIVSSQTHLGRHAWHTIFGIDFFLVPEEEFDEYMERLVEAGVAEFGYFGGWTDERAALFASLGFEARDIDDQLFIVVVPVDR